MIESPSPNGRLFIEQLDRLVDGRLSPAARRALLTELDQRPDGWRRCAGAFLEAQAWREAFAEPVAHLEIEARGEAKRRLAGGRHPAIVLAAVPSEGANVSIGRLPEQATQGARAAREPRGQMASRLVLAASLLCAFGLGFGLHGYGPRMDSRNEHLAKLATAPVVEADTTAVDDATTDELVAVPPRRHLVLMVPSADGDEDPANPIESIDLPVLEPDELANRWNLDSSAELGPEALRTLGRLGHRVERWRALVSVRLNDGGTARVPVEQYRIRYVADDYQ